MVMIAVGQVESLSNGLGDCEGLDATLERPGWSGRMRRMQWMQWIEKIGWTGKDRMDRRGSNVWMYVWKYGLERIECWSGGWWMVDVEDAELMGGWDDDDGGKLLVCVGTKAAPSQDGRGWVVLQAAGAELQAVASFFPSFLAPEQESTIDFEGGFLLCICTLYSARSSDSHRSKTKWSDFGRGRPHFRSLFLGQLFNIARCGAGRKVKGQREWRNTIRSTPAQDNLTQSEREESQRDWTGLMFALGWMPWLPCKALMVCWEGGSGGFWSGFTGSVSAKVVQIDHGGVAKYGVRFGIWYGHCASTRTAWRLLLLMKVFSHQYSVPPRTLSDHGSGWGA
jgi:hypothetical protein